MADLELLAKETHKFESRYLDGLVGPWPAAAAIYKERSPIEALEKFDKPVAFFQVSGFESFVGSGYIDNKYTIVEHYLSSFLPRITMTCRV